MQCVDLVWTWARPECLGLEMSSSVINGQVRRQSQIDFRQKALLRCRMNGNFLGLRASRCHNAFDVSYFVAVGFDVCAQQYHQLNEKSQFISKTQSITLNEDSRTPSIPTLE